MFTRIWASRMDTIVTPLGEEVVSLPVFLTETALDYAYANIVNLDSNNGVVGSFTTNPLFRFIRFYETYEASDLDERLPTLYVGYKEAKARFGVNILTPQFQPLAWWCASPKEDGMRFLKGFQEFLAQIAPALVQDIKTIRTDPVFGPALDSADLVKLFNEHKILVTYLRRGGIHIYTANGNVLVLDAVLYGAYGVDIDRLKIYLKANSSHYHDDENDAIYHFFTNRFEYDPAQVCKYIPYLIWVKVRGQNTDVAVIESKQIVQA